tara:strand:+ start:846 stop:956 length:111 start_codon:yes stop_codon:yes gene_type:complete
MDVELLITGREFIVTPMVMQGNFRQERVQNAIFHIE